MNSILLRLSFVVLAPVLAFSGAPARAADETGVIVCMTDKWDEKEVT